MKQIIIEFIGYILIVLAIEINRNEDSKIKLFSSHWWQALILVTTGVFIISQFGRQII